MTEERPKIRFLEAFPHEEEGRQFVILRDPVQISEATITVTPDLYSMLPLFDGKNSILDIQVELTRRSGEVVSRETVEHFLDTFDQACFLDNDNFRRKYAQIKREYLASEVREASHAGLAYPKDPAQLVEVITSYYRDVQGAGLPGPQGKDFVRAVAAPHIDLRLGGPAFSHAYRAIAESRPADLYLIMGIGHRGLPRPFSVCRKNFQTPLGEAELDRDFLHVFDEELGAPLLADDLSHKTEHSVEFQLVFLQHLLGNQPLKVLPLLSSFSHADVDTESADGTSRSFTSRFVEAVLSSERRTGKRVCFIASVDLAHIGPRYGDSFQPDQLKVQEVMERDTQMLRPIRASNAEGFKSFIRQEADCRRICGFSALYTLLHLVEDWRGSCCPTITARWTKAEPLSLSRAWPGKSRSSHLSHEPFTAAAKRPAPYRESRQSRHRCGRSKGNRLRTATERGRRLDRACREKSCESIKLRRLRGLEIYYRTRMKEKREHGFAAVNLGRNPGIAGNLHQPLTQSFRSAGEGRVGILSAKYVQRLLAGRHSHRIAGEGSSLVHGSLRCHHAHNIRTTTESSDGQSSTQNLAQAGQGGPETEKLLRTSRTQPETCHHLIKDGNSTMLIGQFNQSSQVTDRRHNDPHVPGDRLNNQGSYLIAIATESIFHRPKVVVGKTECQSGELSGSPRSKKERSRVS